MIDRSKCKKMWVWNSSDKKHKRIVIDINDDGGCLAVKAQCKNDFYSNLLYDAGSWLHCEEIKEPKTRLMTRDEAMDFVISDTRIRIKHCTDSKWFFPQTIDMDDELSYYRWC